MGVLLGWGVKGWTIRGDLDKGGTLLHYDSLCAYTKSLHCTDCDGFACAAAQHLSF